MDGTITDTMRLQPYIVKKFLLGNSKDISFRNVQRKMASIYYRNDYTWFKLKTPIYFAKVFNISIFKMILFSPIMGFHYWRAIKHERLFKETCEVIENLKRNGVLVGLATNGKNYEVKLKIPTISDKFKILVTASDVTKKKPDPEMILKGIKKAGVDASETLYVGDTIVDALASSNANTQFALMTTGTFGPEVVAIGKNKPKNIFSNLKELETFVLANK